jgi:CBS domain containing-hemolysin-like protein
MSPAVWAVIFVLILVNALYVAAEFAAVGVRRSRIRQLSEEGHWLAKSLLPVVDDAMQLDRYVGISQIGITLSSLVLGAFAQATVAVALAPMLAGWFGLDSEAATSTAAITVLLTLTIAQVVLGELMPKSLALQFPTQVALATVLPMRWSLAVFRPFLALVNGSATAVLRAFGMGGGSHRHIHSPEEIDMLLVESRDGGLLEPDEQRRLHRALRLGVRTARDLMVPLEKLTMLKDDTPWPDVVRVVAASPFSRLPVYRGAPDTIIGTLRVKDLLHQFVLEGEAPALGRLLRPLARVAHDLPADRVIGLLRERRVHQAVVTSDEGRVIGLITIQDVLAEFLGEDRQ